MALTNIGGALINTDEIIGVTRSEMSDSITLRFYLRGGGEIQLGGKTKSERGAYLERVWLTMNEGAPDLNVTA